MYLNLTSTNDSSLLISEPRIIVKTKIVKFGFFEVFSRDGSNVHLITDYSNYWQQIDKMEKN